MKNPLSLVLVGVLAVGFLLAGLGAGCARQNPSAKTATVTGTGPLIASYDDFKPDALKLEESTLRLAGERIKVKLKKNQKGQNLLVELVAFDTVFEVERYIMNEDGFSVSEVAGEKYFPPIPLIKYGMHVGDGWQWKGQTVAGVEHAATAQITTSTDRLYIAGGAHNDVVRVDVILAIESGTDKPAERKLAFWFVKDMGVVKRDFGPTVREPLEQ